MTTPPVLPLTKTHDLAWCDPQRGYRCIASANVRDELDDVARRYLRRHDRMLYVLTLQPEGVRVPSRYYFRRIWWWPWWIVKRERGAS